MEDLKKVIQARQNEMCAVSRCNNIDEIVKFYTEDCKMMNPGQKTAIGREGIKKLSCSNEMKTLKCQVGKNEQIIEEVFGSKDCDEVCARGSATTYTKDGAVLLQSKSLCVWKKVGGKWLIHNHIWNTDPPMTA